MNVEKIREDFPILKEEFAGKKLVYLDNAATTQKPRQVIEAIKDYYEHYNANVHRGMNFLSRKSTEAYEKAHEKTAELIGAESMEEIIFTKNATEAINLVAYSLGEQLKPGDEILITLMEHHANFVPWKQLSERKKIPIKMVEVTQSGELDMDDFGKKLTKKTKIVAIGHGSNILGTINPVEEITKMAHEVGAKTIVDSAAMAPHKKLNVKKMDADFLAFSAHKMLGPTGIGILYGKKGHLENMQPFLTGGDMISTVTRDKVFWNSLPWKFEAGTPNIAGAVGWSAAIDYLNKIGPDNIHEHEKKLLEYGEKRLGEIKGVHLYGPKTERTGIMPFNLGRIHPHDVAQILDENAIAIRSGNHCAQPLMNEMGVEGMARASFYAYNIKEEIDRLAEAIVQAKKVFGA